MISVIAQLSVKDGEQDQALDLIEVLLQGVAQEKNTLAYTVNRSRKEPCRIVIIERYTDKAALAEHASTAHFKKFNTEIKELLDSKPDVQVLEELLSI